MPPAPTRISASRWSSGSLARAARSSSSSIGAVGLSLATSVFSAISASSGVRAPAAALFGIELVAQDHEGPRLDAGARLERVARLPRLGEGFLGQVVGLGRVVAQAAGERAQVRDRADQLVVKALLEAVDVAIRRLFDSLARQSGSGRLVGFRSSPGPPQDFGFQGRLISRPRAGHRPALPDQAFVRLFQEATGNRRERLR